MIAPNRDSGTSRSDGSWAAARRSVAAAFFGRDERKTDEPGEPPPVSPTLTWIFLGWALGVGVSYFAFGAWWSMPWR
ncbi:MAG: hypothetical protein DWQ37_22855 [Planctomycetota bacterium]|nr:MAG: hypothetical protein DWQ37_22855 [Planctomycetota bacterium]